MAAIDLTTLAAVKAQLTVEQKDETALLPAMITAISRHIYMRTGRRALNASAAFVDTFDGNGSDKQFLPDYPVQSVASVAVFGNAVPQSPDGVQPGWIVGDSYAASIVLLPGTSIGIPLIAAGYLGLGRFPKGRQNVKISYNAGYVTTGGPGVHAAADPYFNGAPSELGQAVTEFVIQQYKKRDWVDQKSKTMTQTGETVVFRDWEIPPWLKLVIGNYTRTWIV